VKETILRCWHREPCISGNSLNTCMIFHLHRARSRYQRRALSQNIYLAG
jgi:hypothetical protein